MQVIENEWNAFGRELAHHLLKHSLGMTGGAADRSEWSIWERWLGR